MKERKFEWVVTWASSAAELQQQLNMIQSDSKNEIFNVVSKGNVLYIIYKEYLESDNKIKQF